VEGERGRRGGEFERFLYGNMVFVFHFVVGSC
jgi:hypothetical protein